MPAEMSEAPKAYLRGCQTRLKMPIVKRVVVGRRLSDGASLRVALPKSALMKS